MKGLRSRNLAASALAASVLAACGGGGSTTASGTVGQSPPVNTFSFRAVQGSPDVGPVDAYIYSTTGSQPPTPLFANLQYPAISAYVALPIGSYTISFDRAGTTAQLLTETVGGTTTGAQVTTALAGQAVKATLQLQNFVEPIESAGTTALLVHHVSPAVDASVSPIGIGVYQATNGSTPGAAATTQLFSFSIAAASATSPGASGPANAGTVSGGQYFTSAPNTLPSPLGFAAGKPSSGSALTSVVTATTLSGLASALNTAGYGQTQSEKTLAQDTANTVPAGAHLSVFVVDSTASAPGILIGTLDP